MNNYLLIISGSDIDYFYDVEKILGPSDAGEAKFKDIKVGGCILNTGIIAANQNVEVKVLDYLKDNDPYTQMIINIMHDNNLDTKNIKYGKDVINGTTLIMNSGNEKCIYYINAKHPLYDYNEHSIANLLNNSSIIYTLAHTYYESFGKDLTPLINAKNNGTKLALDGSSQYQNSNELEILKLTNYLFINQKAYQRLSKLLNCDPKEYLFKHDLEILCLTNGDEGINMFTKDLDFHLDAIKLDNIIDTTGAGDTFAGTFLASILNNYQLKDCLIRANIAAANACKYEGGLGGIIKTEALNQLVDIYQK